MCEKCTTGAALSELVIVKPKKPNVNSVLFWVNSFDVIGKRIESIF